MDKRDKLTILITAAGAPGTSTLIKELRWFFFWREDCSLNIVVVDADMEGKGNYPCIHAMDFPTGNHLTCYKVPPGDDDKYISTLLDIVKKEDVDVVMPISSCEVPEFSLYKHLFPCPVMVSDPRAIINCSDKSLTYEVAKKNGVKVPNSIKVQTVQELAMATKQLGYPQYNSVVVKPCISKGSRGLRILDSYLDKKVDDVVSDFFSKKPDHTRVTFEQLSFHLGGMNAELPSEMIVSEYVEGQPYDCMVLGYKGKALLTTCKTRETENNGVITSGELVVNKVLDESCEIMTEALGLSYNISMQFIGDTLIEINPRPSTFIYSDNFNEPYLAVKLALGDISLAEIISYKEKIPYGRRMLRYYDQICY